MISAIVVRNWYRCWRYRIRRTVVGEIIFVRVVVIAPITIETVLATSGKFTDWHVALDTLM